MGKIESVGMAFDYFPASPCILTAAFRRYAIIEQLIIEGAFPHRPVPARGLSVPEAERSDTGRET